MSYSPSPSSQLNDDLIGGTRQDLIGTTLTTPNKKQSNRSTTNNSKKSKKSTAMMMSTNTNNNATNNQPISYYQQLVTCYGCDRPILDQYLYNVLDRPWHQTCIQCIDCKSNLNDKCFSRDGKLYCRDDFIRRFGPKCSGCNLGIGTHEMVRRAKDRVYHLNCFICYVCRKTIATGEQLYVVDENKFVCKQDYLLNKTGKFLLFFLLEMKFKTK